MALPTRRIFSNFPSFGFCAVLSFTLRLGLTDRAGQPAVLLQFYCCFVPVHLLPASRRPTRISYCFAITNLEPDNPLVFHLVSLSCHLIRQRHVVENRTACCSVESKLEIRGAEHLPPPKHPLLTARITANPQLHVRSD